MSCHKFREWLENCPEAGLVNLPTELREHVDSCRVCSALLKRLAEQSFARLPAGMKAAIPDIKKKVIMQCHVREEKSGSALPVVWKLALLSLVSFLILAVFYVRPGSSGRSQSATVAEALATITRLDREVEKHLAGAPDYVLAAVSDTLAKGDSVRTRKFAEVELTFPSGSTVSLGPDAHFQLSDSNCSGYQQQGRVLFKVKPLAPPVPIEVTTPLGLTAVLGTVFVQEIGTDTSFIGVSEGVVEFRSKADGSNVLRAGQLLLIASSGKVLDMKEIGREAVTALMDLERLLPVPEPLQDYDKVVGDEVSSQTFEAMDVYPASATKQISSEPDSAPEEADIEDVLPEFDETEGSEEGQSGNEDVTTGASNSTLGVSGY